MEKEKKGRNVETSVKNKLPERLKDQNGTTEKEVNQIRANTNNTKNNLTKTNMNILSWQVKR